MAPLLNVLILSLSLSLSLNIMMVVMRDNRQKVSLSNEDATRVGGVNDGFAPLLMLLSWSVFVWDWIKWLS